MTARNVISLNEGAKGARQSALETANPALRAKLSWIIDWQRSEISRSILGRWELGQEIDEVWLDLKKNSGKRFGRDSKATIALFMREDPSIVNMAHKLYRAYQQRTELVDITEMTMQDGITHLSYSHIRQLLSIRDPQKRHELMNRCLENCWTSVELGLAVQEMNGGKQTNNPNGRAAIPKDAETVIDQMISFADDFDSRNLRVWKDPVHSVVAQVDRMEAIQYTEDLAKKLGELAHRMRQLANEAVARAEEAERKYEQVTRVIKLGPATLQPPEDLTDNSEDEAIAAIKKRRGFRPAGRRAKVG
jgi:hypothetical protein